MASFGSFFWPGFPTLFFFFVLQRGENVELALLLLETLRGLNRLPSPVFHHTAKGYEGMACENTCILFFFEIC